MAKNSKNGNMDALLEAAAAPDEAPVAAPEAAPLAVEFTTGWQAPHHNVVWDAKADEHGSPYAMVRFTSDPKDEDYRLISRRLPAMTLFTGWSDLERSGKIKYVSADGCFHLSFEPERLSKAAADLPVGYVNACHGGMETLAGRDVIVPVPESGWAEIYYVNGSFRMGMAVSDDEALDALHKLLPGDSEADFYANLVKEGKMTREEYGARVLSDGALKRAKIFWKHQGIWALVQGNVKVSVGSKIFKYCRKVYENTLDAEGNELGAETVRKNAYTSLYENRVRGRTTDSLAKNEREINRRKAAGESTELVTNADGTEATIPLIVLDAAKSVTGREMVPASFLKPNMAFQLWGAGDQPMPIISRVPTTKEACAALFAEVHNMGWQLSLRQPAAK